MVRAEFDGASLVLTGRLGETALRDAIIERARRLYGPERVTDHLALGTGAIAPWLHAPFPPDLRATRRATALLQDGRLLVIGDTGTDAARTRLESALHALATPGLHIELRINTGDVDLVEPGTASKPRADLAPR
jgi:hypothetical protein